MLRNISLQTKTLAKLSILIQIGLNRKRRNDGYGCLKCSKTRNPIFQSVPHFRISNPFHSDGFPIHNDTISMDF